VRGRKRTVLYLFTLCLREDERRMGYELWARAGIWCLGGRTAGSGASFLRKKKVGQVKKDVAPSLQSISRKGKKEGKEKSRGPGQKRAGIKQKKKKGFQERREGNAGGASTLFR